MADAGVLVGLRLRRSTKRIIWTFVLISLLFAMIYGLPELDGGVVRGLSERVEGDTPVEKHVIPLRSFYFSVVTMTTLGFGDLTAKPNSIPGHALLMVQVAIGYVLLGALITRFAIMFQDGVGPVPRVPAVGEPPWKNSAWWCRRIRCSGSGAG